MSSLAILRLTHVIFLTAETAVLRRTVLLACPFMPLMSCHRHSAFAREVDINVHAPACLLLPKNFTKCPFFKSFPIGLKSSLVITFVVWVWAQD